MKPGHMQQDASMLLALASLFVRVRQFTPHRTHRLWTCWWDGAKAIEALPYREYTEYLSLPAGRHEIRRDYTAIAVGFAGKQPALDLMLPADDNTLPQSNQIKLRVVHAAASAPAR